MSEQAVDKDAPPVEWIVALRMPPHDVGGLSLHQCSVCWALVVEDFMREHEEWHASIAPPGPCPGGHETSDGVIPHPHRVGCCCKDEPYTGHAE